MTDIPQRPSVAASEETSIALTVQQEACQRYLEERVGTVVFALESLPVPWSVFGVKVGDEIVATMRPAEGDGVNWYPPDSDKPEFLTFEQMRERLYTFGDQVVNVGIDGKTNEVPRPKTVTMWEHEIDPANIPATPWRNYRLYTASGGPLAGYYSLDKGRFQYEGAGPRGETFGADKIREEIAACNATSFGPVTLRALTPPKTSPTTAPKGTQQ